MSSMPPFKDNNEAHKLLEPGWVIVKSENVTRRKSRRPVKPTDLNYEGKTGETWTRTDDYIFAGHRHWLPPGAAVPPKDYDFNIGLTETTPGVVDLDPATDLIIGGLVEPPPDGQAYARVNGQWVPAAAVVYSFSWSAGWTPTGNEPIATTPQHIFTAPAIDLPPYAFDWTMIPFVTNIGSGEQLVTGNGGSWTVCIEYPFGSGTWIDVASFPFDDRTFPAEDIMVRCIGYYSNGNRIWHYDPADGGIRFGIKFSEGENFGNLWNVLLGFQGQIVTL